MQYVASGSSGRANSTSKGFDFGTDDILCSYADYGNQDSSNDGHGDAAMVANSSKDFNNSRVTRSAVYNQPEEDLNQNVFSSVDRGMKKHTDNIMRILEGISSRLSQLELYCYNLDKSIGEMRSDLVRDHGEAESKLKSLEKHVQEILRDKQELAATQKELAKLQVVQKESTSSTHSHSNEQRALSQPSEPKKTDNSSETTNQHLALALPHQVNPLQLSIPPAHSQNVTQQQSYYVPSTSLSIPRSYFPSNSLYRTLQLQEVANQPQVSQTPQFQQSFTLYQQLPPQVQPPQQTQIRPQPPPPVYPSYPPNQPTNPSTPESSPSNSMPMQVPFSSSRVDTLPYGYAGPGRPVLQLTPETKATFGAQVGNEYVISGPHPSLPAGNSYMVYDNDGVRIHNPPQQPQYNPGGYTPTSVPLQNAQPAIGLNLMVRNPSHSQYVRNHPHSDLIEKLGNMGLRSDHVAGVIQRLEWNGQPVDFNNVLDELNGHIPQRGW